MTDTIQDRLRDVARDLCFFGKYDRQKTCTEAADEIDRLSQTVRTLRESLTERERELAEANQAIGLLTTLAPQMEIDPDHPLNMAQEIVRELAAKDKRIEELEERSVLEVLEAGCEMLRKGHDGYHIITDDEINLVWKYRNVESRDARFYIDRALSGLGIKACPRCGGTKWVRQGGIPKTGYKICDCRNNGWVLEVSDEDQVL